MRPKAKQTALFGGHEQAVAGGQAVEDVAVDLLRQALYPILQHRVAPQPHAATIDRVYGIAASPFATAVVRTDNLARLPVQMHGVRASSGGNH